MIVTSQSAASRKTKLANRNRNIYANERNYLETRVNKDYFGDPQPPSYTSFLSYFKVRDTLPDPLVDLLALGSHSITS